MVFSSYYFLFYFLPVFLLLYWSSPKKLQNTIALIASCYFYAWGAPEFFIAVFTGLIIDFYLVRLICLSKGTLRKRLLLTSVSLNVLVLIIAKYLNFFTASINEVLNVLTIASIPVTHVVLPIGISFITFQKISYVLDCHSGKTKPQDNFVNYALYIMLFPQLIAGPIVRFREIADQLTNRIANDTIEDKLAGLYRFIIGLAKKILIANVLGEVVDQIFSLPEEHFTTATAWLGVIAYSLQIYFDFSGYSDMAIGLARMMGFRFPENFNFPYISQSITEFWRRWHITLSNWMRDYLYIPLGGNRVSKNRLYFNLVVVFLISGLWHGAAWTFVFWGAFHGLFLILDRLFLVKWLQNRGRLFSILFTYFIVLIGWVFFRSDNFEMAFDYLIQMFSFSGFYLNVYLTSKFWFILMCALIFSFLAVFPKVEQLPEKYFSSNGHWGILTGKTIFTTILAFLCIAELMASDFSPFIYFKF